MSSPLDHALGAAPVLPYQLLEPHPLLGSQQRADACPRLLQALLQARTELAADRVGLLPALSEDRLDLPPLMLR